MTNTTVTSIVQIIIVFAIPGLIMILILIIDYIISLIKKLYNHFKSKRNKTINIKEMIK